MLYLKTLRKHQFLQHKNHISIYTGPSCLKWNFIFSFWTWDVSKFMFQISGNQLFGIDEGMFC